LKLLLKRLLLLKLLLLKLLLLTQLMLALLENNIPHPHEQGTVLFDRPNSQSSWTSW
jgi:hypothetical protein